jgi:RHS repeat-associated protein
MLQIGSIDIVKYEYLGLGQTVIQKYVQPATDVQYTLATGSGVNQYDGLDRSQSFERGEISDSYTATWDAWNRLVELTNDADSDKSVAQYEYDGLNRRIIKRSYTSGTLSETRHQYYSSQWQVLEERVGTSTTPDRQFVWGQRYVDDLLLRDEGGNRLYALQDAQFNVVAITADTGSVEQRFVYQAYGGTDHAWEYRYTGRELDLNTRLQLNRHRYLHLQLGRWCSRDPIGYEDGWNLYRAYFVINRVDPTGLGVATIDYGPCISL